MRWCAWLGVTLWAAPATGQLGADAGDPVGPWHAAESLGALMGSDGERDRADVVHAAQAELALGRPDRALAILESHPMPDTSLGGAAPRVVATALYDQGRYLEAAEVFRRAALLAAGPRRGVLHARAAEAYERVGRFVEASVQYRLAGLELPDVRAWFALREARVMLDSAIAFWLLRQAPPEGRRLAGRARAVVFERAGDTAGAVRALAEIGSFGSAARLSLAFGDSLRARSLAYRGLMGQEPEDVVAAAEVALTAFPPGNGDEAETLIRTLLRHGRASDAAGLAVRLIPRDTTAAALLLGGQALESAGRRRDALGWYEGAMAGGATVDPGDREAAAEAEYRHARALVNMRRRGPALDALRAFVTKYPAHDRTAPAVYLVGDIHEDEGRYVSADSAYRRLVDVWPDAPWASEARFRLATHALAAGDSAGAVALFDRAAEAGGAQALPARFQAGRLRAGMGDVVGARATWIRLALEDSLGYYGAMAREQARLPLPALSPPPPPAPSDRVRSALSVLDMLDAALLDEEAEALIESLVESSFLTMDELLDVADGLNARGRTIRAIRLGRRLADSLTMGHPRILRIVYPWPSRDLVVREAVKFGLDPFLVAAMIRQESAFDAGATSRAGARGLMQLMPATARGVASSMGLDWSNSFLGVADANVHLGVAHLASLLRRYDGDVTVSLAAYNAGGTPVRRWLRYPEAADPFLFVERIPYAETRGYVRAVLRNRALYSALYGEAVMP